MNHHAPDETSSPPDQTPPAKPAARPRRRRRRLLLGGLACLVGVYAVLALVSPRFLANSRAGWAWLFGTNPGVFDEPRILAPEDMVLSIRGRPYLNGGGRRRDHFDITEFRLDPANLHYGLGREYFKALIEPEFLPHDDLIEWYHAHTKVLLVEIGDDARIYPIPWIRLHEVVNDVVGGVPIFAAYCILADLGAVYDRRLTNEITLTFALSGYTYRDPEVWEGRNAFVLWDRDTESLWWPPLGRAVSGPLIDAPLKLLHETQWDQTTWGEAIAKRPDALVFKPRQEFDPPRRWPALDVDDLESLSFDSTSPNAIAPRWGGSGPATQPGATTMPSAPPE